MNTTNEDGAGRPASFAAVLIAVVAGVAVAAFAGLAFAKGSATLNTANNAKLSEKIVVGSSGRTLYVLSVETTHHLVCSSNACLGFWPPLKTTKSAKLTAAAGIKGKLGKIHRNGFYQVTLGGQPVYYFQQDTAKGQANGQGIPLGGGHWHVIVVSKGIASGTTTSTTSTTTTTTTTTTTMPPTTTTTKPYLWA